jgi:hypothetical protein
MFIHASHFFLSLIYYLHQLWVCVLLYVANWFRFCLQSRKQIILAVIQYKLRTAFSSCCICHQCRRLDTVKFLLNDLDVGACIVFIVRTPYLRISNFVSHYEPTYDKNSGNGSLSVILFVQTQ